jgi:dTMP kinase
VAVLRPERSWDDEDVDRRGPAHEVLEVIHAFEVEAEPSVIDAAGGVASTARVDAGPAVAPGDPATGRREGPPGAPGAEPPGDQTEEMYPHGVGDGRARADGVVSVEGEAAAGVERAGWHVRLFGSHEFFRLWLVQVVSATGDWLGFSAIILLAAGIGGGEAGAGAGAISLVMAARIVPGFFFGPVAGVLVDRWDRKKVMIACDLGRAAVIVCLPFVHNLIGLVLASLALEVLTLLWSPAKEAIVPNLVPPDHLTTANSLSLAAAYGTFPFASLLFALLAGVSSWLSSISALDAVGLDQMALAFYVDALTFVAAALLVRTLVIGRRRRPVAADAEAEARRRLGQMLVELKQGWHEIFRNPTVRAVNVGLACGLIGGGMLIPLGAVFSTEVLDAGPAGYGLFTTALGFGVAIGAVGVSAMQRRLPKARVFTGSLLLAGAFLFLAASTSSLGPATLLVGLMGVTVGPVYVMGFVLLHEEVDDELRGRVFSSLSTLVRLCVLVSMVAGPLLAALLNGLSVRWFGGAIEVGGVTIAIPGVRLTLWLAALIIMGAAVLALHSVRAGQRSKAATAGHHPSRPGQP